MKRSQCVSFFFLIAVFVGACATTDQKLGVATSGPVADSISQAPRHEAADALPGALAQYKMAQSASPGNQVIEANIIRLSDKPNQMTEQSHRRGMKHQNGCKHVAAKETFFRAIDLNPEYRCDADMLASRKMQTTSPCVINSVQPGESS